MYVDTVDSGDQAVAQGIQDAIEQLLVQREVRSSQAPVRAGCAGCAACLW